MKVYAHIYLVSMFFIFAELCSAKNQWIIFVTYLSFHWFPFKIPYYEYRRKFFHVHWEAIFFFHDKESYKK